MRYTYICDNIIIVRDTSKIRHTHTRTYTYATYYWQTIIPYELNNDFFEY